MQNDHGHLFFLEGLDLVHEKMQSLNDVTFIDHSHSVCVVFFKKKQNTSSIRQIDPATDCTREASSACH